MLHGRKWGKYHTKTILNSNHIKLAAIAARSLPSAQSFASQHNIPKAYGSYKELLQDSDVDVVYIGTVANSHEELARQAILAHKATIVEKPLCLTRKQTQELVDLSKEHNVFLMEGLWTRCSPPWKRLVNWSTLENGEFGMCTGWLQISGGGR